MVHQGQRAKKAKKVFRDQMVLKEVKVPQDQKESQEKLGLQANKAQKDLMVH